MSATGREYVRGMRITPADEDYLIRAGNAFAALLAVAKAAAHASLAHGRDESPGIALSQALGDLNTMYPDWREWDDLPAVVDARRWRGAPGEEQGHAEPAPHG